MVKLCKICGEEIVGGKFEDYETCPICGDILDDIIAKYLEMVAMKCAQQEFDGITLNMIIKYLDEVVDWVEFFEDLEEFSSDAKYYERFRMVLNKLDLDRVWFEKIIKENYKTCPACGADFTRQCLDIEKDGDWVKVYCGTCGKLISKHYAPKTEL
ncbi:hypothetical protein Asulf_01752 [Archaeoglobus sulfaticallidus PM70-1]|uniref:Uncharacterized protein n=1 Tax=Archaeoglobus sulfaticallidus PM70-1 TaxID=387631 RepID=N0BFC2_9EURY|nr:hypothetical protein [Archaeoglobus sulfaticallidus]AGK61723.1 hypothetical protein Asulf_01752 [Archaeoglobus sulfaticallidus PM70-1]